MNNATDDLLTSPAVLRDLLVVLAGEVLPKDRQARLRDAVWQARRPTIRWTSPARGVHLVNGDNLHSPLAGLDAAWAVITARGMGSVPAAPFAAPGARYASNSVRNALKRAADLLKDIEPALAGEVLAIVVAKGKLLYRPTGKVDVVTA